MKLIELETAKFAKQKNFDLYCEWSYWNDELSEFTPGYALENGTTSQENYFDFPRYYAPYQAVLQEWLRNIHDIHMYVNHYQFACKGSDGYFFHIDKSIMHSDTKYYGPYDTYEEALEEGLYQALKLVK